MPEEVYQRIPGQTGLLVPSAHPSNRGPSPRVHGLGPCGRRLVDVLPRMHHQGATSFEIFAGRVMLLDHAREHTAG